MGQLVEVIEVTSRITNGGDGSASNQWYLTKEEAIYYQSLDPEGWEEECVETVETFIGSRIHKEAVRNSKDLAEEEGYEYNRKNS